MILKTALVNTKDWNMVECMSPARFFNYSKKDFENINAFNEYIYSKKPNELVSICNNLPRCPVKKCRLKEAILINKDTILYNIQSRLLSELDNQIEIVKQRFKNIVW
jgi:hypothetical protein